MGSSVWIKCHAYSCPIYGKLAGMQLHIKDLRSQQGYYSGIFVWFPKDCQFLSKEKVSYWVWTYIK
jgi:hypothetical protein